DQLGLSASQMEAIRGMMADAKMRLVEAQQKLATDTAELNELLKVDSPEEARCLSKLDKVLDDEKSVKHITLSLTLSIRGKLTAEQIAKLNELRSTLASGKGLPGGAGGGMPESLQTKLRQFQELAQERQRAGGDVSGLEGTMEEVKTLVQAGKLA